MQEDEYIQYLRYLNNNIDNYTFVIKDKKCITPNILTIIDADITNLSLVYSIAKTQKWFVKQKDGITYSYHMDTQGIILKFKSLRNIIFEHMGNK